ncbi:hypothetical protein M3Y98_00058600 [Aphelenchoides besseyi]|nr:hypothetical protein M3Y98_00058600 [Aphelenchoides besseyi]
MSFDQRFTVILPSNTFGYANRSNSFRVQLPKTLHFYDGSWQVGLRSIFYTKSWTTIDSETPQWIKMRDTTGNIVTLKVDAATFHTVEHMAQHLTSIMAAVQTPRIRRSVRLTDEQNTQIEKAQQEWSINKSAYDREVEAIREKQRAVDEANVKLAEKTRNHDALETDIKSLEKNDGDLAVLEEKRLQLEQVSNEIAADEEHLKTLVAAVASQDDLIQIAREDATNSLNALNALYAKYNTNEQQISAGVLDAQAAEEEAALAKENDIAVNDQEMLLAEETNRKVEEEALTMEESAVAEEDTLSDEEKKREEEAALAKENDIAVNDQEMLSVEETNREDEEMDTTPTTEKPPAPEDMSEYDEQIAILNELNNVEDIPFTEKIPPGSGFVFDNMRRRFRLHLDPKVEYVKLSDQLAYTLGFKKDRLLVHGSFAHYDCDLTGISHFVIYAPGLIEPSILGDKMVSVLQVVNVSGNQGESAECYFEQPTFYPLAVKEINTIDIELRTLAGKLLPIQYGHTIVTLMFRRAPIF